MAAIASVLAQHNPPLLLEEAIAFEDYSKVRLHHTFSVVTAGTFTDHLGKADLPFCPDASGKECLLRVIHEFRDAAKDSRLHLDTADALYDNFCLVLGGDLRNTWDEIITDLEATQVAGAGWTKTTANFVSDAIPAFVRRFFPSNAFTIQQEYLNSVVKPKTVDCYTLSGRLRLINSLSFYLPGSGGSTLFSSATACKNAFFRLMLPQWQLQFTNSGHQLDDDTYTYDRRVQFMANQQLFYDANLEVCNCRRHFDLGHSNAYARGGVISGRFSPADCSPFCRPFNSHFSPQGRGSRNFHGGHRNNHTFTPYRHMQTPSPFRGGPGRGSPSGQFGSRTSGQAYSTGRGSPGPAYRTRFQTRGCSHQGPSAQCTLFGCSHSQDQHYSHDDQYLADSASSPDPVENLSSPPYSSEDQYYSNSSSYNHHAHVPMEEDYHSSSAPTSNDHYFSQDVDTGDDQYFEGESHNHWLQDY